jgi:hypothetical protein
MDTCSRFRQLVPSNRRYVGVAGQMNVGTNALGKYLFENLRITGNPLGGMLAGVPWNKHGWVDLRDKYHYSWPPDVTTVLPVVIIRDPYFWMRSKSPAALVRIFTTMSHYVSYETSLFSSRWYV